MKKHIYLTILFVCFLLNAKGQDRELADYIIRYPNLDEADLPTNPTNPAPVVWVWDYGAGIARSGFQFATDYDMGNCTVYKENSIVSVPDFIPTEITTQNQVITLELGESLALRTFMEGPVQGTAGAYPFTNTFSRVTNIGSQNAAMNSHGSICMDVAIRGSWYLSKYDPFSEAWDCSRTNTKLDYLYVSPWDADLDPSPGDDRPDGEYYRNSDCNLFRRFSANEAGIHRVTKVRFFREPSGSSNKGTPAISEMFVYVKPAEGPVLVDLPDQRICVGQGEEFTVKADLPTSLKDILAGGADLLGEEEIHWFRFPNSINPAHRVGTSTDGGLTTTITAPTINRTYTYYARTFAGGEYSLTAEEITVDVFKAPIPNFLATNAGCLGYAYSFTNLSIPNDATNVSYTWVFSDGATSTAVNPMHSFATTGVQTATLQMHYILGDCRPEFRTSKQSFNIPVLQINNNQSYTYPSFTFQNVNDNSIETNDYVLAVSAASFSDSWIVNPQNIDVTAKHAYQTGQRGVWRGDASYAYLDERSGYQKINGDLNKITQDLKMAWQGGFNPTMFNWKAAQAYLPIPKWVKATEMTQYSQYGFELENKDALNRYSAALYGYKGQLPTAVAANSTHYEIAFSSFEDLDAGNFQIPVVKEGNNRETVTKKLKTIKIIGAKGDLVILDMPFTELQNFMVEGLMVRGVPYADATKTKVIDDVILACRYPNNDDPNTSLATLEGVGFESLGEWTGELAYYESLRVPRSLLPRVSVVDEEAHAGNYSLQVYSHNTQDFTGHFDQSALELQENKKYVISAWVKVADQQNAATYADQEVGLEIRIDDDESTREVFLPKGQIIEGWQRIEGTFTIPEGSNGLLELNFKNESGAFAYFDDLRFFPSEGNLQSYVYEPDTYRLMATLDNNNYATFYSYDEEGNLYLIRKETTRGIKSIQESVSFQREVEEE